MAGGLREIMTDSTEDKKHFGTVLAGSFGFAPGRCLSPEHISVEFFESRATAS
jgi:hypothetical protein